jgi:hypothetical protein
LITTQVLAFGWKNSMLNASSSFSLTMPLGYGFRTSGLQS